MIRRTLLFLAFFGAVLFAASSSKAATLVVDNDRVQCPFATYTTIQSAVVAAMPGDTIQVCAGIYPENVTVNKSLRVRGAQAGNFYAGRTFAGPNESTVAGILPNVGVFSVEAANVIIDGFSVTNPGNGLGIVVKTVGNDALIINNIIDTIGGATFPDNTVGVYLELGPDRVRIVANLIRNVTGIKSAQGILIGDSTSADPSLNILILLNRIENMTSVTKGAYGVQANNGSRATGYTTLAVLCNTITNLTGQWAHAVGLEGNTPVAIVQGNTISNLVDFNPIPIADAIGVFFQDNPSFASGHVNQNNFDLTAAEYGIAVDPALASIPGDVDGTRNWWGNSSGPGPVGPGTGAKVSPKVRFAPWLRSRSQGCGGRDGDHENSGDNDN